MAEAFIVATSRTAGGRKGGRLAGWHPADLAATVLDSLVARSGDGPYVPAIASVILAKRLVAGSGPQPGAQPCFALFTPADFAAEVSDLDITFSVQRQ